MAKKWGGTSIVQYRSSRKGSVNTWTVFLHPDTWLYCDCPGWRFSRNAPSMEARSCTHTRKVIAAGFVTKAPVWSEARPRWVLVEVTSTDDELQVQTVDPIDATVKRIVLEMLDAAPFRRTASSYRDNGSSGTGSARSINLDGARRGLNMAKVLKKQLRAFVPSDVVVARALPDNPSRPRRGIIFED